MNETIIGRFDRRSLLAGASLIAVAGGASTAAAQGSPEEVLKAGELPDIAIGEANAPVTLIEYASLTCPACANWHKTVLPELKKRFVDTGKVRFIMREYYRNNLDTAAFMLGRCLPADKFYPYMSVMFDKQEAWAFVQGAAVPALFSMAKQVGFTQESFEKCLTDDAKLKAVQDSGDRARTKFGVNATPTFFINGKKLTEAPSIEGLEKAITALLKS